MALAVENLTKHLDSVSNALSAAKKHLTQCIQNLDNKMETQKEISKSIRESASYTFGQNASSFGPTSIFNTPSTGFSGNMFLSSLSLAPSIPTAFGSTTEAENVWFWPPCIQKL